MGHPDLPRSAAATLTQVAVLQRTRIQREFKTAFVRGGRGQLSRGVRVREKGRTYHTRKLHTIPRLTSCMTTKEGGRERCQGQHCRLSRSEPPVRAAGRHVFVWPTTLIGPLASERGSTYHAEGVGGLGVGDLGEGGGHVLEDAGVLADQGEQHATWWWR